MKELHNQAQLQAWLDEPASPVDSPATPVALQALDLTAYTKQILTKELDGSLFLGCQLEDQATCAILEAGALVFPRLDDFAFETHRAQLYDVETLFAGFLESGRDYNRTLDAKIYREYIAQGAAFPPSVRTTLARRLHDHSITDALEDLIANRRVVAIMGGHNMERSSDFYARIASLSRKLTRAGFLMVSGGGPGAMEATHLGAYLAAGDDADLDQALKILRPRPADAAPSKEYADPDWLDRAFQVRERFPLEVTEHQRYVSIGVPTWAYGHEPPAPFATHIAKYFANSVREAGLLTIARSGVVFAPGSSGTTQEIFQDAAQNHYRTAGFESPMVLWDSRFWTETRPVWPLLKSVSKNHVYGQLVRLLDSEEEIFEFLESFEEDAPLPR